MRRGRGVAANSTFGTAVRHTHAVLKFAAQQRLHVWSLCGSLGDDREAYFSRLTGQSFSSSVGEVLSAGCDVSLMLWGEADTGSELSQSVRQLIRVAAAPAGRNAGNLHVHVSGTRKRAEQISHFLLAGDLTLSKFVLRVENPHPVISNTDVPGDAEGVARGAVFVNDRAARPRAKDLRDLLGELIAAVAGRAAKDKRAVIRV